MSTGTIGDRSYVLAEPDGGHDRLLLAFHGSGLNAARFRAFTGNAFDALPRTAVAYLDGHRGNWNDARTRSHFPARRAGVDDVGFATELIARLAGGRPVHAVGYSNGGGMVIRLLHERPGLLSGATLIAVGQPAPDNFLLPDAGFTPTPVAIIHGTRDPIVPFRGGGMPVWARLVFRVGGDLLSAPDTAAYFARRNGLTAPPVETRLTAEVTRTAYAGPAPVTLYTVHGGGHTVPGPVPSPRLMGHTTRDLHTTDVIREMF